LWMWCELKIHLEWDTFQCTFQGIIV
jgi:hypothetical protein